MVPVVAISFGHFFGHFNFPHFWKKVIQVANPNRAQFTKCASYAIPSTTHMTHHIFKMTEIIPINTGTWKHFLRYMYQKILPAMFMNITTHSHHLTEFKLCRVRDPSGISWHRLTSQVSLAPNLAHGQ